MLGEAPQETWASTLCMQKGLHSLWSVRATTIWATGSFPRQQTQCIGHWVVPWPFVWGPLCPVVGTGHLHLHLHLYCSPISSAYFRGSCVFRRGGLYTGYDISEVQAVFLCWVIKPGLPQCGGSPRLAVRTINVNPCGILVWWCPGLDPECGGLPKPPAPDYISFLLT